MADFDPYYVWLGIPPKHQPADHYRLLGIERFESDPPVIESAADRQMAHVKTFQTGKNSADSQRILNHLAQARNCLLSPDEKTAYDQRLRGEFDFGEPAAPLAAPPVKRTPQPPLPSPQPRPAPQPFLSPPFLSPPSPTPSAYAPIVPPAQERAPSFPWPAVLAAVGLSVIALVGIIATLYLVRLGTRQEAKASPRISPKSPLFEPDRSNPSPPIHSPFRLDNPPKREDFGKPPQPEINSPEQDPPTTSSPLPPSIVPAVPAVPSRPAVTPEGAVDHSGSRNLATPPRESPVLAGPPIPILEKIPPQPLVAGGNIAGKWEMVEGKLQAKHGGVMLPVEVPPDYQLDLTVERLQNEGLFVLGIVVAGHQAAVVLDWEIGGSRATGFHVLDGRAADNNESTTRGPIFPNGSPCQLRCIVRGNYVQVLADERAVIQWRGDPARLRVSHDWAVPDWKSLFICSLGDFRISRIELTPYSSPSPPKRRQPKFALAPARRLPPPTGKDLQQARVAVRKLFSKEFTGINSVSARRELARSLLARMKEDRDEVVVRFALLQEAHDLARNALDSNVACQAIEEQARTLELDALALQTAVIEGVAKEHLGNTAPLDLRSTAAAASIYLDKTLLAERLDLAIRLSAVLRRLSVLERSAELKEYAARRSSEVTLAKQLFDAMKPLRGEVGEEPTSAVANLAVGRYQCFVRGDWPQGLLLLSRGSDKDLAAVAALEMAADFRKYYAVADAWWQLSESAAEPWRTEYRQQAKYWYEQVAADLSGLERQGKIVNVKGVARNRLAAGLVGAYYQGDNRDILRATRIEKQINFPWGWGHGSPAVTIPSDQFSAAWSGYIQAPIPGKYRLVVDSDDGSLLKLDGQTLWDEFGGGAGVRSAVADLTGDPQRLEVQYHEGGGTTHCVLRWGLAGAAGDRVVDEISLQHDPLVAREMRAKEVCGDYPNLVSVPAAPKGGLLALFEDQAEFPTMLTEGSGMGTIEADDRYSGEISLRIAEDLRFRSGIPGLRARIRENPGPGEYRYLRLAWKKTGGKVIGLQILTESKPGAGEKFFEWRRYHIGPSENLFPLGGASIRIGEEIPKEWSVITRDLFADYGEFDLTGVALSPVDGTYGLFDHFYLACRLEDFERLGTPVASE